MAALSFTKLDDGDFEQLRAYVYESCGITLDHSKHSLVVGRLQPVLTREGIANYGDYVARVKADHTGRLRSELVDRLSTNHTFFWREADHFDYFAKTALPQAIDTRRRSGNKTLRVWCAAASAGQEPYTLAALMMDTLGQEYAAWDAGLLATDISTQVLEKAKEGVYESEDVARLPEAMRQRHFVRQPDGRWQAHPKLRAEVTYRRFNLMNPSFPFKQPFDVVFIRNVMIYFDKPTQRQILERLAAVIRRGGLLFIGHSENFTDQRELFVLRGKTVYERI